MRWIEMENPIYETCVRRKVQEDRRNVFVLKYGHAFFSKVSRTWKLVKISRPLPQEIPLYPVHAASFAILFPFRAPNLFHWNRLELAERLDGLAGAGQDAEGVETDL